MEAEEKDRLLSEGELEETAGGHCDPRRKLESV